MPWLQTFNSSGRGDSSSFDERPLPFEELGPVGSSFVASDLGDVVGVRLSLNQAFCLGFVRCFSMVWLPSQRFRTSFELRCGLKLPTASNQRQSSSFFVSEGSSLFSPSESYLDYETVEFGRGMFEITFDRRFDRW